MSTTPTWTIDVAAPQTSYNDMSDPSTATDSENTDNYRFLQAKGFLTRHRPCYMVTEAAPTEVTRVTTQQKTIIEETASAGATLYEDYRA